MSNEPQSPAPQYGKIVAKAWSDDNYRQRLIADPKNVLKDEGWDLPDDFQVTVNPDSTACSMVLGLPPKPAGMGADQLKSFAFGTKCCCC